MTLRSIFSLRERSGPATDSDVNGGVSTHYWFWGAAKRLQHRADFNQAHVSKIAPRAKWDDCVRKVSGKNVDSPYAICTTSVGKPTKETVDNKPIKIKHPPKPHVKIHKDIHPILAECMGKILGRPSKKKEAISATQVPLVTVPKVKKESKIKFVANTFRESTATTTDMPEKFRVALITEGLGNMKDAFYYTKDALESAVGVFNGHKIYADHPSLEEEEIRPERSTRDILGHFENLAVEENDSGCAELCADVDTLPGPEFDWARALMVRAVENAEKFPDNPFVGLSINANGDADKTPIDEAIAMAPDGAKDKLVEAKNDGIELVKVVRVIHSAISCDLVTEAGAGGKIKNFIEGE